MSGAAHMVDIAEKAVVARVAEAAGELRLRPRTLRALREGTLEKGDAFEIGRVAAVLAAKRTHELLPLCHPLALEAIDVRFEITDARVRCRVRVAAHGKTGVEMEALVAVTTALLTVWDVVKPLEKDARGQYPVARLGAVRVLRKVKG